MATAPAVAETTPTIIPAATLTIMPETPTTTAAILEKAAIPTAPTVAIAPAAIPAQMEDKSRLRVTKKAAAASSPLIPLNHNVTIPKWDTSSTIKWQTVDIPITKRCARTVEKNWLRNSISGTKIQRSPKLKETTYRRVQTVGIGPCSVDSAVM